MELSNEVDVLCMAVVDNPCLQPCIIINCIHYLHISPLKCPAFMSLSPDLVSGFENYCKWSKWYRYNDGTTCYMTPRTILSRALILHLFFSQTTRCNDMSKVFINLYPRVTGMKQVHTWDQFYHTGELGVIQLVGFV